MPVSVFASTFYTSAGGNLAAIDTITGKGMIVGPTGFGDFWGSAFAPSGTFYALICVSFLSR